MLCELSRVIFVLRLLLHRIGWLLLGGGWPLFWRVLKILLLPMHFQYSVKVPENREKGKYSSSAPGASSTEFIGSEFLES